VPCYCGVGMPDPPVVMPHLLGYYSTMVESIGDATSAMQMVEILLLLLQQHKVTTEVYNILFSAKEGQSQQQQYQQQQPPNV